MLGNNRTITRTNINVLINIGPGAGGGRKRRGKKGNLSNTFDDDCSFALVQYLHICNSPVGFRGGGGVGGTQQMFIRGGLVPRSNPLPFYIPFFTKKVPLLYIFY